MRLNHALTQQGFQLTWPRSHPPLPPALQWFNRGISRLAKPSHSMAHSGSFTALPCFALPSGIARQHLLATLRHGSISDRICRIRLCTSTSIYYGVSSLLSLASGRYDRRAEARRLPHSLVEPPSSLISEMACVRSARISWAIAAGGSAAEATAVRPLVCMHQLADSGVAGNGVRLQVIHDGWQHRSAGNKTSWHSYDFFDR